VYTAVEERAAGVVSKLRIHQSSLRQRNILTRNPIPKTSHSPDSISEITILLVLFFCLTENHLAAGGGGYACNILGKSPSRFDIPPDGLSPRRGGRA
jgi:hypothetical protein